MSTTNTLDLNNRVDALEKAVSGGDSAQANKADIATVFNTTTNYTAGNFVYYQGKLYQFNTDHTAGAWDPTDVVEANVTDQVVSNTSAIAGLTASDVAYDNTVSGLTATDVQGAVDELAQSYPADNVMLSDGVTSVEDAIDEVASGLTKKAHFYNVQGGDSVSVEASSCILFAKRDHQQSAYNVNAIYYLDEGNAWAMVNSGGNTNAISTSYSNGTITITNNNEVAIYACVIA